MTYREQRCLHLGAALAWIATIALTSMSCRESTLTASAEEGANPPVAGHDHRAHPQAEDEIAYYTCAMHPTVRASVPGNCPICGMTLQPVTVGEANSGVVVIDAQRRQTIGVRTERAERRPLMVSIRAPGKVAYDQSRLADVNLKVRGWVGEVRVNTLGERVERDQVLFTLYSPELYAAQEELLSAVASRKAAGSGRVDYLVEAARRRLRLWDLTPSQVDEIVRAGVPRQYLPIQSPIGGYVIEKNLVTGAAVEPGARLYRIAALDRVWVEAELYESDASLVQVGDSARITLPYQSGAETSGRVGLVYPYFDDATRTLRVRVELDNESLALKPDMYANVVLDKPLGEHLAVPGDAVLSAGERSFVFVDLGGGRLKPQRVSVGRRAGDFVEILDGLSEGEQVVTSGNFFVAAESRLKVDMEQWK